MKNEDLKILTSTELAVWSLLGEIEPRRVALAIELVLVDAITSRKARAGVSLEVDRLIEIARNPELVAS